MALGGKVDDDVWMLFFKQLKYGFAVADIRFDKTEVRIVHHGCERGKVAGIGQLVQTNNAVIRILAQHMEDKVGADKAGASGYDNGHRRSSSAVLWDGSGRWELYMRVAVREQRSKKMRANKHRLRLINHILQHFSIPVKQ